MQAVHARTAAPQFAQQPSPFVAQLAVRYGQALGRRNTRELCPIEVVAASRSLGVNVRQVGIDRGAGEGGAPETLELGVMPVTGGPAAKHFAGKQCLAPKRDQALCVKVPRVKRPEAQGR
jgi:hypothetical protein